MLHIPGPDYRVDLPGHVVNNRGEVGGPVEAHGFETLVIGLHHPLDAVAVGVLWIPILHRKQENKAVDKQRNTSETLQMSLIIQFFQS